MNYFKKIFNLNNKFYISLPGKNNIELLKISINGKETKLTNLNKVL